MELDEVMRTTGTCRVFDDRPVPDDVFYRAIDAARFGPQGGNRQPVRWIVVHDQRLRRALADLYLPIWRRHYDSHSDEFKADRRVAAANTFAEQFAVHPALVVVCVEESALMVTDRDLARTSVVGGASIYPLVQNLCLALRNLGVGSAVTTLLCESEAEVKDLLSIPDDYLTAAVIAVGYPRHGFSARLSRRDPAELVFRDAFGNAMFASHGVIASPND